MASTTTTPPPPSSSDHIVITLGVTIPTSIAATQQPTVVWTGQTGHDASVQTEDASVDVAQQAAAPALHSQNTPYTSQETVPRPEIVEEAEEEAGAAAAAEPEAEDRAPEDRAAAEPEDRAPEANVDCFTNLKRSHWLRVAIVGAFNGLIAPASTILDLSFLLSSQNILHKKNLPYFTPIITGAVTMAVGEYMSIKTQLDMQERSGLVERGSPNPWIASVFSFVAFILGALLTSTPFGYVLANFDYYYRVAAFAIIVSLGSGVLGWCGAKLGRTPVFRSIIRYVVGGWIVTAITVGYVMALYLLDAYGH